jgi:hypothetical protein
MAVGATDLALRNFGQNPLPTQALPDHPAHVSDLVAKVIELEDSDLSLSTVHTRMIAEIVAKFDPEFLACLPSSGVDLRVVPLSVGGVPRPAAIPTAGLQPVP